MISRPSLFKDFAYAALVAGNLLAVIGCNHPFKAANFSISSSTTSGIASGPVNLTATAYSNSVYPYVKTVGCTGCHTSGPTAPVDWFASPTITAAFQSAVNLVNTSNVSSSLFAVRIADGHCGFPAICGVSNTAMITAINNWITLSVAEAAAGTGGTTAACTFNGQMIAGGSSITGYSSATVPFGQSCDTVKINVSCANGVLSPATAFGTCAPATATSCSLNGQAILSGATITAYQASTVPDGSVCVSQVRTCTNGTLSGTYTFASCAVNAPTNCLFNNMSVVSGSTVQGYPAATVPFGQTCKVEPIACANGKLTPANDVATCSVMPGATCAFNGQSILSGGTALAYQTGSVPAGSVCSSQTRTCTNGVLSGTYPFSSCTVGAPATCAFNNMTLQSGGTAQGYSSATVPFGQTCKAETITCTNGTLSPATDVAACSVTPGASCTLNGQSIASGGTAVAYQAATVPFGSTCTAQTRTCTNGVLNGTFSFASCTVSPAATCAFNNATIQNGGTTQGYPSATVPFGQTCKAETITCSNGTLSPANDVAACTVTAGAPCAFNGQSLANGQSTSGYASATVAAGQVCSSITVTCSNGALTPASASPTCTAASTTSAFGSAFVPTNQAILLRLNVGLTFPNKSAFVCQNANNCSNLWNTSAQYNVSFKSDPNTSTGANQISLLAFAGCNDIDPAAWGVSVGSTVSAQTTNLINAGIQFVDNHTGGLGSNSTYKAQVTAAFQALINDPSYAGAKVQAVFVGICTAANTFGIGMKGF